MASGHRSTGVSNIDWSSEPPAPPQQDLSPEDEDSPAHRREDKMLSFHARPPVALPEGTLLLPNGTLRFPNSTILLTEFSNNTSRPAALLPSGDILLGNGTRISSNITHLPPPGITVQVEKLSGAYNLLLPRGSLIYRNGSIAIGNHSMIMTVFRNGFIPGCDGVKCHRHSLSKN